MPRLQDCLTPLSCTQHVGHPRAVKTSCQPSPLWIPCQGPVPSSHLCRPHCPGCWMLPASWHRQWALVWEADHGLGPFVPAFLCLPTLCLGEWESQHVCCVNTSWNPVIEIAEGVRPHPPAAWGPVPPSAVGVGKQVSGSQPVTHPFTHRTARPGLDRCLEPARVAPGRERDSEGPALSPLAQLHELPSRRGLQALAG